MRVLITAGPTREYIDPVRFITNGSTGKMGYACAEAAVRQGHEVVLVTGPVSISPPAGVSVVSVMSSQEMADVVLEQFSDVDCVIMTAAVGDYKPEVTAEHKMQKGDGPLMLKLVRTIDILASLGEKKKDGQILIGFAVQDVDAKEKAHDKLRRKNLDAIVLNGPSSFGSDQTDMHILRADRGWNDYPNIAKKDIAEIIIRTAEEFLKR